jgi:hypothetical protein
MKTNILTLLLFVLTVPAFAQSGKTETQNLNTLWLKNCEGQTVKTSGDTVPRSYFLIKEVTIHSQKPPKNEDCYIVILQPSDGSMSKAHFLPAATFPAVLISWLEKAPLGTRVTFTIGNKKGGSSVGPTAALQVVLGE